MSTDAPDALADVPPPKPPARRDPLDTDLLTMVDQARSVATQLRVVPPARAALPAVHHDADDLAAGLDVLLEAADTARKRAADAKFDTDWARRPRLGLVDETNQWVRHLHVSAKLAGVDAGAAVDLHAVTRGPRYTAARCVSDVEGAVRLLDARGLSTQPLLRDAAARAVDLLARLTAHVEAVRVAELAAREAARARAAARAALLAELRRVRALWTAAHNLTPGGIPALDLRISRAASAQPPPPPPVEPTDAEDGAHLVGVGSGGTADAADAAATAPPAEVSEVAPECPPDERTKWIRFEFGERD
jgi:hypothetical protein